MATARLALKNDAASGNPVPSADWNAIANAVEAHDLQMAPLYAQSSVAGGDTLNNSVSETAFASYYTLAANELTVGDILEIEAFGVYGSDATPGNLTLAFKWGSTTLATTGANAQSASLANRGWHARIRAIVRSLGATGTLEVQGMAILSTAAATGVIVDLENTATVTVDTTASADLKLFKTHSVAHASNTITLRSLIVRLQRA